MGVFGTHKHTHYFGVQRLWILFSRFWRGNSPSHTHSWVEGILEEQNSCLSQPLFIAYCRHWNKCSTGSDLWRDKMLPMVTHVSYSQYLLCLQARTAQVLMVSEPNFTKVAISFQFYQFMIMSPFFVGDSLRTREWHYQCHSLLSMLLGVALRVIFFVRKFW